MVFRAVMILLLSLVATRLSAEPLVVKYIGSNPGVSEQYYLDMLNAAFKTTQKTPGDYRIDFSEEHITSQRKRELMISGDRINVDRFVVDDRDVYKESNILQIRYPLLQGYLGYRVPLIRKNSQPLFDGVKTLDDFVKIRMGMGAGWEGWLYQKNGFSVVEPIGMTMLLKMLAGGRFDFVPLGVTEIESSYEVESNQPLDLVPENHLLIHYTLSPYFFVSARHPELAKRLEMGLRKIDKNGEAKKIFDRYYSAKLQALALEKRTVIDLTNFHSADMAFEYTTPAKKTLH